MLILSVAVLIVVVKSIVLSVFMLMTFSITTLNTDIKCSITIEKCDT